MSYPKIHTFYLYRITVLPQLICTCYNIMRRLWEQNGFANIKHLSRKYFFMDVTSLISWVVPWGFENVFCLKGYTIPDVVQIPVVCQGGLSLIPWAYLALGYTICSPACNCCIRLLQTGFLQYCPMDHKTCLLTSFHK